jgi:hypothetical protein
LTEKQNLARDLCHQQLTEKLASTQEYKVPLIKSAFRPRLDLQHSAVRRERYNIEVQQKENGHLQLLRNFSRKQN